ncbi:MAG: ribosome silencing factor [Deltaproteobacteria bacterium]
MQPKGSAVAARPEPTTSESLARDIVALADGKKAQDIVVLSMDEAVSYTDYFVVVSGANSRQTRAIADEIQQRLRADRRPARVEGEREGEWILIDYIDVVVHIFTTTARDFYRLETLWGDVPRLDVPTEG